MRRSRSIVPSNSRLSVWIGIVRPEVSILHTEQWRTCDQLARSGNGAPVPEGLVDVHTLGEYASDIELLLVDGGVGRIRVNGWVKLVRRSILRTG